MLRKGIKIVWIYRKHNLTNLFPMPEINDAMNDKTSTRGRIYREKFRVERRRSPVPVRRLFSKETILFLSEIYEINSCIDFFFLLVLFRWAEYQLNCKGGSSVMLSDARPTGVFLGLDVRAVRIKGAVNLNVIKSSTRR